MNARRAAIVAAIGISIGCARPDEPQRQTGPQKTSPPVQPASVQKVTVTITPADMMSATSDTPLTLWFDFGTQPVPASVMEAVRKTVQLEEYDTASAVPFDLQEQPSAGQSSPSHSTAPKGTSPAPRAPVVTTSNPMRASLTVVPKVNLESQWYRLSFDSTAAQVEVMASMNPAGPDGRHGSRFNPGHAPTVRSVTSCGMPPTRKLVVRFSESVTAQSMADLTLADNSKTSCKWNSNAPGTPQEMYGFLCPSSSQTLLLALADLKSVDGQVATVANVAGKAPVFTPAPVNQVLDFVNAIQSEATCKTWVP